MDHTLGPQDHLTQSTEPKVTSKLWQWPHSAEITHITTQRSSNMETSECIK